MQKSGDTPKVDEATAARGRGRPRAFDRDAALAQATRLFWLKGYEATSIADLTEAMGIGSPSLYAAFGSKESLYAEALGYYAGKYEGLVWSNFKSAHTAREAVELYLMDSAAALTGCVLDIPRGCMVTLGSIGSEGHLKLEELLRAARADTLDRLEARLNAAIAKGEIPDSADAHGIARYLQAIQSGMSILARDGASRADLQSVARGAMLGWDALIAER